MRELIDEEKYQTAADQFEVEGDLGDTSDIASMDFGDLFSRQFNSYTGVCHHLGGIMALKAFLKGELDNVRGELYKGYRNSGEKLTEAAIKANVDTDATVLRYRQALSRLDFWTIQFTGLQEAFRQRHYSLLALSRIHTTSVIGAEHV